MHLEVFQASLRNVLSHREESCGASALLCPRKPREWSPEAGKTNRGASKERYFLFKFKITSPEASPSKVLARPLLEEGTW